MVFESRAQKLIGEMYKLERVTSAKIENKNYYDMAKKVKDTYILDLRKKGITLTKITAEYPPEI